MKKLIALLCMITCILSLTACTSTADQESSYTDQYDAAMIQEYTESIMTSILSYDVAQIEGLMEARNSEVATTNAEALRVKESFRSWLESYEKLGSFEEFMGFEMTADEDTVTGTVTAQFSERNTRFSVTFLYDLSTYTEFKFAPIYSLSESMADAGLNTILGMGTVFVVLIFIAFLISLFKYINKAETHFANKKAAKEDAKRISDFVPVSPERAPVFMEQPQPTEVDDLELIAVITAAVAAAANKPADQLIVRSIKKKSTNKWHKA